MTNNPHDYKAAKKRLELICWKESWRCDSYTLGNKCIAFLSDYANEIKSALERCIAIDAKDSIVDRYRQQKIRKKKELDQAFDLSDLHGTDNE